MFTGISKIVAEKSGPSPIRLPLDFALSVQGGSAALLNTPEIARMNASIQRMNEQTAALINSQRVSVGMSEAAKEFLFGVEQLVIAQDHLSVASQLLSNHRENLERHTWEQEQARIFPTRTEIRQWFENFLQQISSFLKREEGEK